jgi:hypothetical protein
MDKQIITDMFLTKEAFEQYARQLREETAKKHGMTLEEWDAAITNGTVVQQPSGSNNGTFRGEF